MRVITTDFSVENTILYNLDRYAGKSITVSDTGITADAEGNKIVPAGSFLSITGTIVTDDTAKYVLLHTTDVTGGPISATGIYRGTVDVSKLPVAPTQAVKDSISGIVFMENDSNY